MPHSLHVKRADMQFEAQFAKPSFGLLEDTAGLLQRVYHALASFRLTPAELKVESASRSLQEASPGQWSTVGSLYFLYSTLRVTIDRLEFTCTDLMQADPTRVHEAIVASLEAVAPFLGEPAFRGFSWMQAAHGYLDGIAPKDFVARFTSPIPTGLGTPLGSSATFYYGDSSRIASAVTVDLSGTLENGLFVRHFTTWDAAQIQPAALPEKAAQYRDAVFKALELTISS